MKMIESNLIGRCPITAKDKSVRLFQVKEVLNRHRTKLINTLLKDIPYFIGQKYHAFATPEEVEIIKSKLTYLQSRDIDLTNYASIVHEVQRRSIVKLNNEAFFKEVDQLLLQKQTN